MMLPSTPGRTTETFLCYKLRFAHLTLPDAGHNAADVLIVTRKKPEATAVSTNRRFMKDVFRTALLTEELVDSLFSSGVAGAAGRSASAWNRDCISFDSGADRGSVKHGGHYKNPVDPFLLDDL